MLIGLMDSEVREMNHKKRQSNYMIHIANERSMRNRKIARYQGALDSAIFSVKTRSILITQKGSVIQVEGPEGMKKKVLSA
jgi:hypothetical protein